MRFRPLLWPTLMALPMLAVLIALGVWQLERRAWKLQLIDQMDQRLGAAETPLADALRLGDPAYRRVVVTGRFDHAKEVYWLTPGPEGEPVYHVLTPLLREAEPAILIDRGSIPLALKEPASRPAGQLQGAVTIHGVLRESQPPGPFTPADDPSRGLIYTRDAGRIAAAIGLTPVLPVFIEADASPNPGGYPIGGQTRTTLRNAHLEYALTWFGLAATLLIVYLLYHRSRGRL